MKSSPTEEEVAMNKPEIMNDNHIDSPPKSVASSASSASSSSTLTDSPSELSSFSSPGLGVPKEVTSSNNSSSSEINQTTTPETISTITKKRKNQKHPSLPTIPSGGTIQEQSPESEPESEPKPESEHKPKPEHEYEHDPQPLKQTHNDDINSYIPGAESGLSTFGSENTGVSYDSMSDNGEDREGKKQHKEEHKQQSTPPKSNSKKKKKKKKKVQSGDNPPSHMIKRRRRKLATIEPDSCSYYIFQEEEEKRQKEQQQQQNDDNNSDNDDNNDDNNSDNNSDNDDETEENTNNKQQEQQHVEYSNNEKDKRRFMLPHNQYECILRRRAVVKEENKLQHSNIDTPRSTSSPAQLPKEKITMTTNVTKRRTLFASFKASTTEPSATNNNNGNNSDDNRSDKNSTKTSSIDPKQKQSQSECLDEIYGDTTVGMKLSILSGKVIILSIIPLNDGRASPAQLVGHIQRGDVILSINNKSLVNVPFDEVSVLVDRLAPLSHPSSKDGLVFAREVKIRFEVGTGLELLEKDNSKKNNAIQQQKKKQQSVDDYDGIERKEDPVVGNGTSTANNMDGANDLFNLSKFTFVDQFTGQPFFDDHDMNINEMKKNDTNRNQRCSLPTTIETSEEDNSQQIDTPKKEK